MHILKPILFLALFLLFVTLMAVGDSGNAADRVRSQMPKGVYDYRQPYENDAITPNNATWRNQKWTPNYYGLQQKGSAANEAIIARFERAGLITGLIESKNGMNAVQVGDLFLRLDDGDQNRVMQTFGKVMGQTFPALAQATYLIEHENTGQFLGTYSAKGLQIQ